MPLVSHTLAVPPELDAAARAWEDHQASLHAAAGRVAGAGTGGFTPAVAGPARELVAAWTRLLGDAAGAAERQAEGLRRSSADYRATDVAVAAAHRSVVVERQ